MFRGRGLCDAPQRNPLTKIFSTYLHVCRSLFSILWSSLYLLYLLTQPISISVVPADCDLVVYPLRPVADSHWFPDCPLVDLLRLFSSVLVVLFVSLLCPHYLFCIYILLRLPLTPSNRRLTLVFILWILLPMVFFKKRWKLLTDVIKYILINIVKQIKEETNSIQ